MNISHLIGYRAQTPYHVLRRNDEVFLRFTVDSGWHRVGGGSERRDQQVNSLRMVMARAATSAPPIQIESCGVLYCSIGPTFTCRNRWLSRGEIG